MKKMTRYRFNISYSMIIKSLSIQKKTQTEKMKKRNEKKKNLRD